jgi:death-on-curing protein
VLRDAGLLASAVGRPALVVFGEDPYPTLSHKAAALMESLCLNHAFVQRNKRTAVIAVIHMLIELHSGPIDFGAIDDIDLG